MNEPERSAEWPASQKFLHWLMALMIFTQIGLGILMELWKPNIQTSFMLIQIHKSLGFSILMLVLLRLLMRLRYGGQPFPAAMPQWERWLANSVHSLLYAAMIALPLTGWLAGSAAGFQTKPFGLFALPDLIAKDRALYLTLRSVHGTLALTIALLLGVHIAGALKHHFIDRDEVLRRMLPRWMGGGKTGLPPEPESD